MNVFVPLGPVSMPLNVLLLMLAFALALLLSWWHARQTGVNAEKAIWLVMLAGLLGARVGFVLGSLEAYLSAPLSLLDFRDGGFSAGWGLAGIWLATLLIVHRQVALRTPLLRGVMVLSSVLLVMLALAALPTSSNRPIPAIAVQSLDGSPAHLPGFSGKPTVINLWASWCGPCRREMPVLEQAQQDNPDFNVVFLNQGEGRVTVEEFLRSTGLQLDNVLLDRTTEMGHVLGQRGLPVTLFYDAGGTLNDIRLGELSRGSLAQRMDALRMNQSEEN